MLSSFVGLFGQAEITVAIALGIAVARWRHRRRDAIVPLFILLTILVEAALKLVVPQAPPPHERSRSVALLPLFQAPFTHSFPSGHMARATFLLLLDRLPAAVVVAGVLVMAATRIYLGEHWLSDTIGGALLGLGVAVVARRAAATRTS